MGSRSETRGTAKVRPSKPRRRSLKSQDVANRIREALAAGVFRPGVTLTEQAVHAHLAELQLDVPRMPIRTALAQLEADGIVASISKKGATIHLPDDAELRQIFDARLALEEFVLVQLANAVHPDLGAAVAANEQLRALVATAQRASPTAEQQRRFAQLDEAFHSALADAAGYPRVAHEIALLRLRLQIATQSDTRTVKRLRPEVVAEHQAMLWALGEDAVGARGGAGVLPVRQLASTSPPADRPSKRRPDVNLVRWTYRMHMQNSAKHWWRIEQRIRQPASSLGSSPNYVFDVPDLPDLEHSLELLPPGLLLIVRLSIELCAVRILASRPDVNTATLEALNQEMRRLAALEAAGGLHADEQAQFQELDLSFHKALVLLSGLLCAEEVVAHAWTQLQRWGNYGRGPERRGAIVDQHAEIIRSIRASSGRPTDLKKAREALLIHLTSGFRQNEFVPEARRRIRADAKLFRQALKMALLDQEPL